MSSQALNELKSTLSGEIVGPGEEGYDFGIARWSDSCSKPATYVVFPKNAEDVAAAIKFGRGEGLELAICGGGHSWSGASSTTGLVIHLGKYLNTARCDPEERLLYVGGGALWETVDKAAYEHGLAIVGGTVNHTGVGGLTLGGGYGWLSGRHGVTSDNLVKLTVVLASGEIVTASETEHPDLFWGCRGGGSNFGVVTEFVLKAYPQRPTVFLTILTFSVDKLEAFVEGVESWFETVTPDEACAFGFTQAGPQPSPGGPSIQMIYFYNGSPEDGKNAAKKLYDIGPIGEMPFNELPYVQVNSMMNQASGHGGRKYMKGVTVQPKFTLETAKTLLAAMTESVKDDPGFLVSGCQFEYVPKQAIASVPLESSAFTGRGMGRECLIFAMYTDPALDPKARDTVRHWARVLSEPRSTDGGKGEEGYVAGYTNYDPEPKSAALAFGPNYNRLREVKRRYDPENVWRKWYPIEPAPLAS